MSGSRRKRLEKLEKKLADLTSQDTLANCNCQELTFVGSKEKFQTEMSRCCPAHGFRRLGRITIVDIVPTRLRERAGQVDRESLGVEELIAEYRRRLAEVERAEEEHEYGWQEP
jgi:hypothetical protein